MSIVSVVFPPIKTHVLLKLVITNAVPISERACQQNNPAVWVPGGRHSFGRWAEETLDAVSGLEINSKPHCNRRVGVATAVTCEGSGTFHILSFSVSPFSSFLFLFAFSFQSSQQVSWLYIHMSDAPQTSFQHILDPALTVWFSIAAWWHLWFVWDGTRGFRPHSNLRTSPAARRRGCRCAPPLSGTPAPPPPASQWSGRSCDPTLLGTSTLQLCCLYLTRVDSVQVRAADKAPPQSGGQNRVSFRDVCEQGLWGGDGSRCSQKTHNPRKSLKQLRKRGKKRCWLGISKSSVPCLVMLRMCAVT